MLCSAHDNFLSLPLKNKTKQHHRNQHKDWVMLKTIWLIQQVCFCDKSNSNPVYPTRCYSQTHKPRVFSFSYWCIPIFLLASYCFPTCHPASNSSPVLPPGSLALFHQKLLEWRNVWQKTIVEEPSWGLSRMPCCTRQCQCACETPGVAM